MSVLAALSGLWWLALVGLLLGSAALAGAFRGPGRQPWKRSPGPVKVEVATSGDFEMAEVDAPLSIIVPLRDESEARSEANAGLAGLGYPAEEILFSIRRDQVGQMAGRLPYQAGEEPGARCGEGSVRVALIATSARSGWNPKLANLVEPIASAANDVILVKDAATILPPGAVAAMIGAHGPGVGLVSAVPIARRPEGLLAHVEAALINTYGARMLLAFAALGGGAGIGAAMLFRRSDLHSAGGLAAIAVAIADDHALARLLAGQGLRTVFAAETVDQALGPRSLREIWARHLRWAICRRLEEPLTFAAEPVTGLAAASLTAVGVADLLDVCAAWPVLVTLLLWPAVEGLLAARKGWPLSWITPLAILLRELIMPVLWLHALLARRIAWGTTTIPVSAKRQPS